MRPYTHDEQLNRYVFEESFVLGVEPGERSFTFRMDVAPSNTNPRWHPPPPTDAITLWRGRLIFTGADAVHFKPSGVPAARDASGEVDFGSIDRFELTDHGYSLAGEWGDLEVEGGSVSVVLDDPELQA